MKKKIAKLLISVSMSVVTAVYAFPAMAGAKNDISPKTYPMVGATAFDYVGDSRDEVKVKSAVGSSELAFNESDEELEAADYTAAAASNYSESKNVVGGDFDLSTPEGSLNSIVLSPVITNDAEIDARVAEIMAEVTTSSMTNYEKLTAVYNWIINNTYYQLDPGTYRQAYVSEKDTKVVAQSYSVLFKGYGSCANYASAFTVMARAIGLDAYVMRGYFINRSGSRVEHSWVNIDVNGVLYTFDPQVEDSSWNGQGEVPKNYFLKSDEEIGSRFSYSDRQGDIDGFNYFKLK